MFVVGAILAGGLITYSNRNQDKNFGSTDRNSEYTSTTTNSTWNTFTKKLIAECPQSIGSVVITNATAGSAFNLYDATSTTDLSQILIASFSSTATAGDYVFDRYLTRGLVADMLTSNIASTTITCR